MITIDAKQANNKHKLITNFKALIAIQHKNKTTKIIEMIKIASFIIK